MAMVRFAFLGLLLIGGSIFLTACGSEDGTPTITHRHQSAMPITSIAVTAVSDDLHLVWVEHPANGTAQAFHSLSTDGGNHWSEPVVIHTDQPAPGRVRRDNDLQLVASGRELLVAWQSRGEGFMGSGPMVLARSSDQGRTWEAAKAPATPEDAAAHGFFALSTAPDDSIHMAWLDNRSGQQGLQYAVTRDQGRTWSPTETLRTATCQCCWNSLAHEGEATYVLYRGLEPRDMALMARQGKDAPWQDQGPVGEFNWHIDGCPHVGGALAANTEDEALHALIWTGHQDHEGLYYLVRRGGENAFEAPRSVGTPAARHGDLAITPEGNLLAAWDEPDHGSLHAAWLGEEGFTAPLTVRQSRTQRVQRPLLAITDSLGHIVWTENDAEGRSAWVIAKLPLPR